MQEVESHAHIQLQVHRSFLAQLHYYVFVPRENVAVHDLAFCGGSVDSMINPEFPMRRVGWEMSHDLMLLS